jgi:predicted Zn finger-like uncharacterized protein
MKFVCSNCKAKYQIADEKAAGRTLRMTCRRCNNEIVIQGSPAPGGTGARRDPRLERSATPPPPAAASALAADFRRQVASGGSDLTSSLVSDEWHVAINDIPVGPMRRDEVARKISIGAVTPESLAWREGLDDWMPAADIPDLAMLFGAQLSAPPPPTEVRPAARARVVPVGGRVGVEASPAVIEDIVIPEQPQERLSSSGAISAHTNPPPPSEGQNAGRLFLMVSAGVFVMFVGVVIGVKVLTPAAPAPIVQAAPTEAAATKPNEEESEEDSENVIALDMQEIDGQASAARAKAKTGAEATKKVVGANGRQLSAAEQAMLDQFSGGGATPSIKTRPANISGETNSGGGEGLSASQLSGVVNKKRSELQRCYESALRATASDETVRLDVDITVGISGTVTKVGTRGKALPGMDTCIERTVRMWRFPTASGDTRTSFPVVFQPGA